MHLSVTHILWISKLFVYLVEPAGAHPVRDNGPAFESPHFSRKTAPTNSIDTVEGSPVKIQCLLPSDIKKRDVTRKDITWFVNDLEIGLEDQRHYELTASKLTLHIKKVTMDDAGTFTCVVATASGQYHRSSTALKVISEPDFTLEHVASDFPEFEIPEETSFAEIPIGPPKFLFKNISGEEEAEKITSRHLVHPAGITLVLPCPAVGNPRPDIKWSSNDLATNDLNQNVNANGTLRLADVQVRESGIYTCTAQNAFGTVTFSYDVLIITPANRLPAIIESDYPKNVTAYLGQPAVMECKIISSAHPHMAWGRLPLFNGSVRSDEYGYTYHEQLSSQDERYNLSDITRLIIKNATFNDTGPYYCIVENSYGPAAMKIGFLTVLPKLLAENSGPGRLSLLLGAGVCLFIILLVIVVYRFIICNSEKQLARRKLGELPPNMKMKRHIKIYRKESEISDESLLPSFVYEESFVPVEYTVTNSGSIGTSRTTTISHCNSIIEYVDLDRKFEFPREALVFDPTAPPLGEGAFGKVFRAEALNIRGKQEKTTVAVKTPKVDDLDADQIDNYMNLLREMDIMAKMSHENVIKLYGCCTQPSDEPLYIIMEYAVHGNLKDFLRAQRANEGYLQPKGVMPLSSRDLLRFSYQIASGVKYLTDKKILHRDLAARNILVAENYVMKVADFGLSKNVQGHDYYKKQHFQGRLPVKWMAPETMSEEQEYRYSTESDVWSFGVVMWEIMAFGASPYPTMTRPDHIYEFLKHDKRLEQPRDCPDEIYQIMLDCWVWYPSRRPKFATIVQRLEDQLQLTADYLALGSQPNIYIVDNQEYMETAH